MNLSELYDIALEMLAEKKSNGFGFSVNDNSTISVIVSDDGSIFKASNGNTIENGQLKNTCSEYEAVTTMMKSNKTRIEYLITLDIESGAFVSPCNSCAELMVQINPDNIYCNVMVDINEAVQLHTLLPNISISDKPKENPQKSSNSDDDWLDGWDDDFGTSTSVDSQNTQAKSTMENSMVEENINPFEDNKPITKKDPFQSLPFFEDNPMPNQPANTNNNKSSSYYQSRYSNSTPTPVSSSTLVSSVQLNSVTFKRSKSNSEITDKMLQSGLSESDKKDFNKQRLFNAFTNENVININGSQDISAMVDSAEKQTLTKKELIKMAKEKKKMAKKDSKILDASNKKR